MDLQTFVDIARYMLPGGVTTALIATVSFPCSLVVAFLVTVPRVNRIPLLSWLADFYVDFIRTTPLLLHLFFIYFALPFVGIRFDPIPAGVLTLSLHVGAYQSEVMKAAYASVPRELVEAARVLGMTPSVRLRRVILPIAARVALPGLANSLIEIFLDTVVLSVVTVQEIFFRRQLYLEQSYGQGRFEGLVVLVIFFVVLLVPAGRIVRRLERRVAFL